MILIKMWSLFKRIIPFKLKLRYWDISSKIRSKFIGPYAHAILVNVHNNRILVPTEDLFAGRSLAYHGSYQKDQIDLLLAALNNESNVLVVGAHVGMYLIPLARKVKYIVGIEANPDTFELLKMNVKLNELTNVDLFNFAAGNKETFIEFIKLKTNTGASRINIGTEYLSEFPEIVNVPMKMLDKELRGKDFDLIVMDIEGSEYFAFQGMQNILRKCKILQVEVDPRHIKEITGIKPSQFFQQLKPYFDSARINNSKVYCKDEFDDLLDKICKEGAQDILFSKAA